MQPEMPTDMLGWMDLAVTKEKERVALGSDATAAVYPKGTITPILPSGG
jgi:hypothetical protein